MEKRKVWLFGAINCFLVTGFIGTMLLALKQNRWERQGHSVWGMPYGVSMLLQDSGVRPDKLLIINK
ncbi:hypothetical protein J0X14_07780 [Muricauda sp. CAU 1633]|uniref:hypothetical protein n=1 Tax=Allomuricauda sp. CAU 1633 TaxID=2816036 RepID=UPI001A8D7AC3|nr:hypothetical protein [Muricauda sp. CAU 1633]MBO0322191.1 hypothetical protein [Muricauda sp. CAU 1633]